MTAIAPEKMDEILTDIIAAEDAQNPIMCGVPDGQLATFWRDCHRCGAPAYVCDKHREFVDLVAVLFPNAEVVCAQCAAPLAFPIDWHKL